MLKKNNVKMKKLIFVLIYAALTNYGFSQTIYESPAGTNFKLGESWKQKNLDIITQKIGEIYSFCDFAEDLSFDAYFQKSFSDSIKTPYILFKTTLLDKVNINEEIKKGVTYFQNNKYLEDASKEFCNNIFEIEIENNNIYIDTVSNILIASYDAKIENIEIDFIMGFCIEENSFEQLYCYASKEQTEIKKEFIRIIYSKNKFNNKNIVLAKKYFNEALAYSKQNNHLRAISLYSKAIDNYPLNNKMEKAQAFYNRGFHKKFTNDLNGALLDFSEAIKLQPKDYKSYNNRGYIKLELQDYKGAIEDFNKTIEFDNYKSEFTIIAIGNRGIAKLNLNQDGCKDLKESINLGNLEIMEIFKQNCK